MTSPCRTSLTAAISAVNLNITTTEPRTTQHSEERNSRADTSIRADINVKANVEDQNPERQDGTDD